jgi:hypothetical protein
MCVLTVCGGPAVHDLAAHVGEQQTHAGAFELTGYLVQDRGVESHDTA